MKSRVDKELDEAVELFETAGRPDEVVVPSFRSCRKLKRARPDYQPGPVKVYTQEEIDEYVARQIPD